MRIRVTDVETTGTEPTDAVVEIGAWDLHIKSQSPEELNFTILPVGEVFVNPRRAIPPAASAVHHITDDDVKGALGFDEAAHAFLNDPVTAYAAHNAKFEQQWFTPQLTGDRPWICTLRGAYRVWPDAPAFNNQALRYWLNPIGLDRNIANVAHRAGPDAYVTAFLLLELLKRASFDELVKWSAEPALLPSIPFGKHRGAKWSAVPVDYLSWILRQPDMDEDVKHTAQHWLRNV